MIRSIAATAVFVAALSQSPTAAAAPATHTFQIPAFSFGSGSSAMGPAPYTSVVSATVGGTPGVTTFAVDTWRIVYDNSRVVVTWVNLATGRSGSVELVEQPRAPEFPLRLVARADVETGSGPVAASAASAAWLSPGAGVFVVP